MKTCSGRAVVTPKFDFAFVKNQNPEYSFFFISMKGMKKSGRTNFLKQKLKRIIFGLL